MRKRSLFLCYVAPYVAIAEIEFGFSKQFLAVFGRFELVVARKHVADIQ